MSETAPEEVAPEDEPGFAQRLAAGTGGGDWHYSEADLAAQAAAEAAAAGDTVVGFAERLAQGTGGMSFHLTPEDIAADAAYREAHPQPEITPYVEGGLTPEQQATVAAAGPPSTTTPEPQAASQPGPTPGEPETAPAG